MNNIYDIPQSELGTSEDSKALAALLNNQKKFLAPIISFFSCITALVIMTFSGFSGFVFLLLIPSVIAGVIIKYLCGLIEIKYRLVSALTVAVANFLFLMGNALIGFAVAGISILIVLTVSKRPLNYDQEKLIYRWEMNRLKP